MMSYRVSNRLEPLSDVPIHKSGFDGAKEVQRLPRECPDELLEGDRKHSHHQKEWMHHSAVAVQCFCCCKQKVLWRSTAV